MPELNDNGISLLKMTKRELPTWRGMDPSSQLVTVLGQRVFQFSNFLVYVEGIEIV